MTAYNFHGMKFTDDDIADHFYDEDWSWFKKNLGFKPKNSSDAELLIEKWKKGQALIHQFEGMKDEAELRALSKHSLEHVPTDAQYHRMMKLGKKLGYKR